MKIVHAEESAKPNGTIGVIYGPEGIGKTCPTCRRELGL